MLGIDKAWIGSHIRLSLEFRRMNVRGSGSHVGPLALEQGVVRGLGPTRSCDEKADFIEAQNIPRCLDCGQAQECRSAAILDQSIIE